MFSVFFRLQQVGGPPYLSQIGCIAAAVALFAGTLILGESYVWTTWAGALVIAAGIAPGVISERRCSRAQGPDGVKAQPIPATVSGLQRGARD